MLDMTGNFFFIMVTFWNFLCCWVKWDNANRSSEEVKRGGYLDSKNKRYNASRAKQENEESSKNAAVYIRSR